MDRRSAHEGFTLLELLLALTLLAVLFVGAWRFLSLCAATLHASQVAAELDVAVQKIHNRIPSELRESGSDEDGTEYLTSHPLTETTVAPALTFRMRRDFTGNPVVDWGSPITYELAAEPREIPGNAVDDDGDGVVDEQKLTRTQNGDTAVLAEGITQLLFSRQAGEFHVDFQATVSRAFGADRTLMTRVITATVALENKGIP